MFVVLQTARAQDFDQPVGVLQPAVDLHDVKIVQRLGNQVPLGAEFRNRQGRAVRLGELLQSRPVLVLPIFYQCTGVCSLELQDLVDTLPKMTKWRIGRDFDVVVLSINPKEGPDLALSKFQSTVSASPGLAGTEPGWHFLTGTLTSIRSVTDALGFYYTYDADKDLVNHPAGIIFLTPSGVVSSYILGASYSTDGLSKNLDLAAKNRVGEKSADIFFGCIHIDPLTGQRSLAIQGVLRLLGLATILTIAATLAVLSKKRKARI
ncbi:MAG: SCO family protein [Fimbriimonadales bacterium]